MKKIVLIDGNSLMFRSYYATAYSGNMMQNKQGLYTNAVFGFCNMMTKIEEENMSHIFVAFDMGAKTIRHQTFDAYKGTRKDIPKELLMQIPYIKQFLDIKHITQSEMSDYEADDLLATVAMQAKSQGFDVEIITGDKDMLQLVDERIRVLITRKGATEFEEFNQDNFFEKMGIYPNQIPDYKGLVGDSSDNLPGIKGIGQKTAIKLLTEFKTLENIIAHVEKISGKTKDLIIEGQEMGLQCKMLATLERHIDLPFSLEDTQIKDFNVDALVQFYQEMEFTSLMKRLDIKKQDAKDIDIKIIDSSDYDFSMLSHSYLIGEIFGENYFKGEFLGFGLVDDEHTYFVTSKTVFENQSFHQFLANDSIEKYSFSFKKWYVLLKKRGIQVNNIAFDLLLATYVLNPNQANEDFKKVADVFVTTAINYDESIYGSKSKAAIPTVESIANHAVSKCLIVKQLKNQIMSQIKDNNQEQLLDLEMRLATVLGEMEINGLKIDVEKLRNIEIDLTKKQKDVAQEIYAMAGETFNINSTKQVGDILFGKLGLPTGKKNKTGFSTNVDVLEKLALKFPIAQAILDYRAITKLISTYVNGLLELANENAEVHPLYKQTLTVTGRLSSIEPNIQNMPIRTELGQVIRDAFISRFDDGVLLSVDYSQIELRILAHLSKDEAMIALFKESADFHKQTASQMYEVNLDDVTKDMRRAAKAINFGIIYGMSAWGLGEALKIPQDEAQRYIEKYFATFKQVKSFLDDTVISAKNNGYTKTLFNRIRYIPEINNSNKALASFGERTAMNSPIQGSAADIIKMAMIEVYQKMKPMQSKMIAQVHDELLFDVCPGELDILKTMIVEIMENVTTLAVPLVADVSYGKTWLKT